MAAFNPMSDYQTNGNAFVHKHFSNYQTGDGMNFVKVTSRQNADGYFGTSEKSMEFEIPKRYMHNIRKMFLRYTIKNTSGTTGTAGLVPTMYHVNRIEIQVNDAILETLYPEAQHHVSCLDADFIAQAGAYYLLSATGYGTAATGVMGLATQTTGTYYLPINSHALVQSGLNLTLLDPNQIVKVVFYFTHEKNLLATGTCGTGSTGTSLGMGEATLWFINRNFGALNESLKALLKNRTVIYPLIEERLQIFRSQSVPASTASPLYLGITAAESSNIAALYVGARTTGSTGAARYAFTRLSHLTLQDENGRSVYDYMVPVPIFLMDLYDKYNDSQFFKNINWQGYTWSMDPIASLRDGVRTGTGFIGNNWKLGINAASAATKDIVVLSYHHQALQKTPDGRLIRSNVK